MPPDKAPQSSRNALPRKGGPRAAPRVCILHLAPDMETGTEAREVLDLAIQSHRAGWRPVIASAGGPLVPEAERAAVRHFAVPLNRGHVLARWRARTQLEALARRERPALLHAHGFSMLAPALALAATRRLPLLVDLTEPAEASATCA
jgi:hypothetical protein